MAKGLASGLETGLAMGRALDVAIMPQRCVFCGLENDEPMCAGCEADLPWQRHACFRCAAAVPVGTPPDVACADCQAQPPPFERTVAPLAYAFPVDAAIAALKFRRKLYYLPALARILEQAADQLPAGIDGVLPVPLHRWRRTRRGFNQSRELAVPVAKHLELPLIDSVRRVRATPYQSGSTAAMRRRNLKSAFAVVGELEYDHVLIIDDVVTTGATCGELARSVMAGGVGVVTVMALARA